jgi:hypothetical protein
MTATGTSVSGIEVAGVDAEDVGLSLLFSFLIKRLLKRDPKKTAGE